MPQLGCRWLVRDMTPLFISSRKGGMGWAGDCSPDCSPDFCLLHGTFWDGTDTAPAFIGACLTYLHHNDAFSDLQGDNLQSLDPFTG